MLRVQSLQQNRNKFAAFVEAEVSGLRDKSYLLTSVFVACSTSQQHASVSHGRICLTSQQHASVSHGRICLTSQQHASVSHGRICSDNCKCCHTEMEAADETFSHTQLQYTDTGPTRRLAGQPLECPVLSRWYNSTRKKSPRRKQESNKGCAALEADTVTTRPRRRTP